MRKFFVSENNCPQSLNSPPPSRLALARPEREKTFRLPHLRLIIFKFLLIEWRAAKKVATNRNFDCCRWRKFFFSFARIRLEVDGERVEKKRERGRTGSE